MADQSRPGADDWDLPPTLRPTSGQPVYGVPEQAAPGTGPWADTTYGYRTPDPDTAAPPPPRSGASSILGSVAGSAAVDAASRAVRSALGRGSDEPATGAPAGAADALSSAAATVGRGWQSRAGLGAGYAVGAGAGFSGGKDLVNAARGKVEAGQSRAKLAFKGALKVAVSVGAVMATEQARRHGFGSLVPSFASRGR